MPVDNTGVATAARCASLALELLAQVIDVSKPPERDAWAARARQESEALRRFAEEDIAAYNRYLESKQATSLRDAIEIPMKAAHAVIVGTELCAAIAKSVKAALAADLRVAAALLSAALRGILQCVHVNLQAAGDDPGYADVRAELRELKSRIGG